MAPFLDKAPTWIRQAVLVVAAGAAGYLSTLGVDGGFIRDIWGGLTQASPPVAMVLFVLLLRSEAKREEANRQCNDRTIDFIKSTNLQANSADRTAEAFKELSPVLQTIATAIGVAKTRRRRRRTAGERA